MGGEPSATSEAAGARGAPGPGRGDAWLDGGASPPRVIAAALAWALAVAPAAFSRGSGSGAKALAVAGLLAGIAGPLSTRVGRAFARHVGISAFLALAVGAWLLSRQAIGAERLEPVRAGLGALAFGVWALSWGDVFRGGARAPSEPGPVLPARSRLPRLAVAVSAVSVLLALGIAALAWRVSDPSRALLGHAAALAASVGMVSAGATVAISRGAARPPARRVPSAARRTIALLAVVAAVGVVALALRGS